MAIIEQVDSDSDVEDIQYHQQSTPSHVKAAPTLRTPAIPDSLRNSTIYRQVLKSKLALDGVQLNGLVAAQGVQSVLEQLVDIAIYTLRDQSADKLDLTLVEKIAAAITLLSRHDLSNITSSLSTLCKTLLHEATQVLTIPHIYTIPTYEQNADTSKIQSYWRAGALGLIQLIHVVLKIPAFHSEVLADSDVKSNMVIALCKFLPSSTAGGDWTSQSHEEQWTSQLAGRISQGTLSQILPVNGSGIELSRHILTTYIKPIFSASPNVFVDPETGRKLHRPLGGDLFRDTFRDDPWKGKTERDAELGAVGCWRVYEYVLEMLQASDLEQIWPLLVPPLMTMLDDHEPTYRRYGVRAVHIFLERVPPTLLVRTGLIELIQRSLTTSYAYTSDASSIPMIRQAVSANILLINRVYPKFLQGQQQIYIQPLTTARHRSKHAPESPQLLRFQSLCSLYQNTIVNLFAYSSNSIPFTTLALHLIPILLKHLGQGCIRYLSDTLPVICTILGGSPAARTLGNTLWTRESCEQLCAAASAICSFGDCCAGTGRIGRWTGMILSAVATAWSNAREGGTPRIGVDVPRLEAELKRVVTSLRKHGDEQTEKDMQMIRALDSDLFNDLFVT